MRMPRSSRKLTLNHDISEKTVNCTAGCRVEFTALENAGLAVPGNLGFTLRCVLMAADPGPDTEVLFTFQQVFRFTTPQPLGVDVVFNANPAEEILDEDTSGNDEIRARYTLVNNSNGSRLIKTSNRVDLVIN